MASTPKRVRIGGVLAPGPPPWPPPEQIFSLGFAMVVYPTMVLLRVTRALERALADLKAGRPMPRRDSVTREQYEKVVDLAACAVLEREFRRS